MAQWGTFVGTAGVVLAIMLVLSYLTQRAVRTENGAALTAPSTGAVIGNVLLTHGVLGIVLVGAAIYTAVPAGSLGLESSRPSLISALGIGTGLGVMLFLLSEGSVWLADHYSIEHDESVRELLAPTSLVGWLVLALLVLPLVAAVEELLFRAILIGVIARVWELSPWLVVLPSAAAFGIGHSLQGRLGMVVTGVLGVGLGAGYILTGNLATVIVAHYLINLLEFVRHEGPIATTRS